MAAITSNFEKIVDLIAAIIVSIKTSNLKFMNRNKHLSLSSHDAGLGLFTQLLAYKVEETGCQLVAVNPAYTSQVCSNCESIVEKSLSVRVHRCPDCGLELDRDVNAARNVLLKAFKTLGLSVQDPTWAGCVERVLRSGRLQATE